MIHKTNAYIFILAKVTTMIMFYLVKHNHLNLVLNNSHMVHITWNLEKMESPGLFDKYGRKVIVPCNKVKGIRENTKKNQRELCHEKSLL